MLTNKKTKLLERNVYKKYINLLFNYNILLKKSLFINLFKKILRNSFSTYDLLSNHQFFSVLNSDLKKIEENIKNH
jgi:hypothetical protein